MSGTINVLKSIETQVNLKNNKYGNNPNKLEVKTVTFSLLNKDSIYNNGKLSQKVGLSFKGSVLATKDNVTAFKIAFENIENKYPERSPAENKDDIIKHIKSTNDLEIFEKLYTRKEDGKYSFSDWDLYSIFLKLNKESAENIPILLDAKDISGKDRFDGWSVRNITGNLNADNSKCLLTLINAKNKNGEHRFSNDNISALLNNATGQNSAGLIPLVEARNETRTDHRFDYNTIIDLLSRLNKRNTQFLPLILNAKDETNRLRFENKNIPVLLSNMDNHNGEKLKPLLDAKDQNGKYRFTDNDIKVLMILTCNQTLSDNDLNKIISGNLDELSPDMKIELCSACRKNFDSSEFVDEIRRSIVNSFIKTDQIDDKTVENTFIALENLDKSIRNADFESFAKTGLPMLNNKLDITQSPENCKKLFEDLNVIFETFPEFKKIIGKKQHETHAYTLDTHILKALQEFINDPDYKDLSENDKKIAKLAVLFHDIEKKEEEVDPTHPENSALKAYGMIQKLNLSVRENERIYGQIRNHHWLQKINQNLICSDDVAFEFRKPGDFQIAQIFTRSDLKAIGNGFGKEYIDDLKKYAPIIEQQINHIYETGIYLPQTQIPKSSKINTPETVIKSNEGSTVNKIIKINKNTNFESLGFANGTNYDNFALITHVVSNQNKNITKDIDYASIEGNNGIFSASYITPDKFCTYSGLNSGFVFDVDPNNIASAIACNIASGFGKDLEDFKNYVLASQNKPNNQEILSDRKRFSNDLKEIGKISDQKYSALFKDLCQYHSLTDIKDVQKRELINNAVKKIMLNVKDEHNEVVVYAPKPAAIFTKEDTLDKIPYNLRLYAQEHNLPILVF